MTAPPFQTFFAEHRDAVWRLLVATVGPQDAEDCFQETWLAALRAWPPRDTTNLKGWLYAVARNKATDEHRARARRPLAHADPPEVTATQTRPNGASTVPTATSGSAEARNRSRTASGTPGPELRNERSAMSASVS